jgi:hypothetical protein
MDNRFLEDEPLALALDFVVLEGRSSCSSASSDSEAGVGLVSLVVGFGLRSRFLGRWLLFFFLYLLFDNLRFRLPFPICLRPFGDLGFTLRSGAFKLYNLVGGLGRLWASAWTWERVSASPWGSTGTWAQVWSAKHVSPASS